MTAVLFKPWLDHSYAALIGPPGDNQQDFWNTWYAAVGADYHHFFTTTLVRFPEGALLNYHSFAYPQIFTVALLTKFLGTDHATLIHLQDLTLLSSFPLAGVGMFYLARRFTHDTLASVVGGYVFAFNPSHVAHAMQHMHVSHIEFIPFFVFAYLEALDKECPLWLAAAVLFYALSALFCWYYLYYIAYFVIFHIAYLRLHDKKPLDGWPLKATLGCLLGTAALLSPLLVPMVFQSGMHGIYVSGSNKYVADIEGFFAFPPTHVFGWWSKPFYERTSNNYWEATVYLGLANIALMVWLYFRSRKVADPITNYLLWGIAVFAVLAGGDSLHAFGYGTLLPLPGILMSHLPFLANARTPSRAIVIVYLLLSIGVAYALSTAARNWRMPEMRFALAAIIAFIVFDFCPTQLQMSDGSCSKGFDLIRDDREPGFGVLSVPAELGGNIAMYQQTCHHRPIVTAVIARTLRPSLADRLEWKDLAVQKVQLKQAHVKYIVVNNEESRPEHPKAKTRVVFGGRFPWFRFVPIVQVPPDAARERYMQTYATVFRSPELSILRVY